MIKTIAIVTVCTIGYWFLIHPFVDLFIHERKQRTKSTKKYSDGILQENCSIAEKINESTKSAILECRKILRNADNALSGVNIILDTEITAEVDGKEVVFCIGYGRHDDQLELDLSRSQWSSGIDVLWKRRIGSSGWSKPHQLWYAPLPVRVAASAHFQDLIDAISEKIGERVDEALKLGQE